MKKITTLTLAFILIAFFAISCGDDPVETEQKEESELEKELFPFTTSSWLYERFIYSKDGTWTGKGYIAIKINELDDEGKYEISNLFNLSREYYCYNEDDGFYLQEENDEKKLAFKYPAENGEEWEAYGKLITVLNTDTLITVDEVEYNCYCYKGIELEPFDAWSYDYFLYFIKPGFGIVKGVYIEEDAEVSHDRSEIFIKSIEERE